MLLCHEMLLLAEPRKSYILACRKMLFCATVFMQNS